MKISAKNAGAAVAFVILAILVYVIIPKTKTEEAVEEKNVNTDNLDKIEFRVSTASVFRGDLIKWVTANGVIKASKELEVQSNAGGYIKELNIYEGKKAAKEELLLALDDTEYQLQYRNALSRFNSAFIEYRLNVGDSTINAETIAKGNEIEKKMEELEKLREYGKITRSEYEKKSDSLQEEMVLSGARRRDVAADKTNLTSARNEKRRAELNLEYTKIKAPFAGVIGDCDLIKGQRINAGVKLFKIFEVGTLKVEVRVLENEVASITEGGIAEVMINSIPGVKFNGRVANISPHIDIETKTCKVIVEMKNTDSRIKPGMFATVNIQAGTFKNRLLAPREALVVRDNRNLMFVVVDGEAKWEYFDLGEQNYQYVEIKSENIKPGDEVVVKGHINLAHESKVTVVEKLK